MYYSNIHYVIVANDTLPVALMMSKGHLNDSPQGRILLRKLDGQFNGSSLLMDRAYEGNATRSLVESLGMRPIVPPKSNRKKPWEYDKILYKRRNEAKSFRRRF